jgi:hypothetical protein
MIEGLYIHIPFCASKCPYCDFVSFVSEPSKEYLELLKRELELYKDLPFDLKTVYLGGGTPSLYPTKLWREFFKDLDTRGVKEIIFYPPFCLFDPFRFGAKATRPWHCNYLLFYSLFCPLFLWAKVKILSWLFCPSFAFVSSAVAFLKGLSKKENTHSP